MWQRLRNQNQLRLKRILQPQLVAEATTLVYEKGVEGRINSISAGGREEGTADEDGDGDGGGRAFQLLAIPWPDVADAVWEKQKQLFSSLVENPYTNRVLGDEADRADVQARDEEEGGGSGGGDRLASTTMTSSASKASGETPRESSEDGSDVTESTDNYNKRKKPTGGREATGGKRKLSTGGREGGREGGRGGGGNGRQGGGRAGAGGRGRQSLG